MRHVKVVLLIVMVLCWSLLAGTSHTILGLVYYPDHTQPLAATFRAYIETRPGEVLTESSPGCRYGDTSEGKAWQCQVGSFPTSWQQYDRLVVEVESSDHYVGTVEITLDINASSWADALYLQFPKPGSFTNLSPANNSTGNPTELRLEWEASSGATEYDIYMDYGSGNDHYATTTNAYLDVVDLLCFQTLTWKVVAKNEGGATTGPVWRFQTWTCGPPGTFSYVSPADGAANQPTSVRLAWTEAARTLSYDVYVDYSDGSTLADNTTNTFIDLDTLICSTTVGWKVVAKNGSGSTAGAVRHFSTIPCVPPPGNFSYLYPADATGNQPTSLRFQWTAASGATAYDLYIDKAYATTPWGTTTQTYLDVEDLDCLSIYAWKVVAKNAGGVTSGPIWNFITQNCEAPAVPTYISPADRAVAQELDLTFCWNPAQNAQSYELYLDPQDANTRVATTTNTEFTVNGLDCNQTYAWRVKAINEFGTTWGPLVHFETLLCGTAPAQFMHTYPSNHASSQPASVQLHWQPAEGATLYEVYASSDFNPQVILAGTTTEANLTLHDLLGCSRYSWRVVALNDNGATPSQSAWWDFTTQGCPPVPVIVTAMMDGKPFFELDSGRMDSPLFVIDDVPVNAAILPLNWDVHSLHQLTANTNYIYQKSDSAYYYAFNERGVFQSWNHSELPDLRFEVTEMIPVDLTAYFNKQFKVDILPALPGAEAGEIQIVAGAPTPDGWFEEKITLQAMPKAGYEFLHWQGGTGTPDTAMAAYGSTELRKELDHGCWVRGVFRQNATAIGPRGFEPTAAEGQDKKFQLRAFPNPFNAQVTIQYYLPEPAPVEVSVFDIRGERVKKLLRGDVSIGKHQVAWDGTDHSNAAVSSGVYVIIIQAGSTIYSHKISFIR